MLGKDLGNGTPANVSKEQSINLEELTDPAGENRFIVYVALNPGHQMFDVCRSGHFRGALEILGILPEVLEPMYVRG